MAGATTNNLLENVPMILTRKFIMDNRTERGSWTRAQVEAIGVEWPPRQGWIENVIGQEVPDEKAHLFAKSKTVRASKAKPVCENQLDLFG